MGLAVPSALGLRGMHAHIKVLFTREGHSTSIPLAYSQRCRWNVDVHSDDVFVQQREGGGVMQTNWLLAAVALFLDAHWLRSGMLGSGLGCSSRAPFHFPGAFHYVMTFQDGMEVECGRANAP